MTTIDKEDVVIWVANGKFTTQSTWVGPLLFDSIGMSLNGLLLLAGKLMLRNKDRLRRWGMTVDARCVLCSQQNESLQLLFFDCDFSSFIWSNILSRFKSKGGQGIGIWSFIGLLGTVGVTP